jgi:hypothetical protein
MRSSLLVLILAGCANPEAPAASPTRSEAHAYTCAGHPDPPPAPVPRNDMPIGRLEVAAIDAPAKPSEVSLQGLAARRVRILAEAVPLGTLATALSERLGIGIAVDADLIGLRVSMAAHDMTLLVFFDVLASEYSVRAAFNEGFVRLKTSAAYTRMLHARGDLQPVITRMIPVPGRTSPEQLAATYCALIAGPRGSASVVGDKLVANDVGDRLNLLEELVRATSTETKGR